MLGRESRVLFGTQRLGRRKPAADTTVYNRTSQHHQSSNLQPHSAATSDREGSPAWVRRHNPSGYISPERNPPLGFPVVIIATPFGTEQELSYP